MVSVCGSDVAFAGTDEQSDSASAAGAIVPVHGVPLTVVPALEGTVTVDDAGVDASPGSASPTPSAVRPVTVSRIWERTYAGTGPPELMVRAYALAVRFPAEGNRNLARRQGRPCGKPNPTNKVGPGSPDASGLALDDVVERDRRVGEAEDAGGVAAE